MRGTGGEVEDWVEDKLRCEYLKSKLGKGYSFPPGRDDEIGALPVFTLESVGSAYASNVRVVGVFLAFSLR
jgi:hypothetical protein